MKAMLTLEKDRGITLVELLVALVVSSLLLAAIYRTFIAGQKIYVVQDQVVEMQQNLRTTFDKMTDEIMMAGFGNVSMLLPAGVTIGGTTYNNLVNWDTPVAGSLTILSAMGSTTLKEDVLASNKVIKVNSLTDAQGNTLFDLGDRKYVSIGGVQSCFITGIAGTTLTLSGNLTCNHPVGTPVFAIRAVSYQVDGTLTLLRDEIPRPTTQQQQQPQPLADNIENLQFEYRDANGDWAINPQNIRMVRMTVRARTERPDPDMGNTGDYRRRTLSSNIKIRNLGLNS